MAGEIVAGVTAVALIGMALHVYSRGEMLTFAEVLGNERLVVATLDCIPREQRSTRQ